MRVLWGGAGGAEVVVSQAREETGLSKVMTGPASGMRLAADTRRTAESANQKAERQ